MDSQHYLDLIIMLKDVVNIQKEYISSLQKDNSDLRTHISIILNELSEKNLLTNTHHNIPRIIENNNDSDEDDNEEHPIYSVPPHIRRNYLENLNLDNNCPICGNNVESIHTMELTECGHLFHKDCLTLHRETNQNCPVCNNNLINN